MTAISRFGVGAAVALAALCGVQGVHAVAPSAALLKASQIQARQLNHSHQARRMTRHASVTAATPASAQIAAAPTKETKDKKPKDEQKLVRDDVNKKKDAGKLASTPPMPKKPGAKKADQKLA